MPRWWHEAVFKDVLLVRGDLLALRSCELAQASHVQGSEASGALEVHILAGCQEFIQKVHTAATLAGCCGCVTAAIKCPWSCFLGRVLNAVGSIHGHSKQAWPTLAIFGSRVPEVALRAIRLLNLFAIDRKTTCCCLLLLAL